MTGPDFTPLRDYGDLAPASDPLAGRLATYLRHYQLDAALARGASLYAGYLAIAGYRLWVQRWRPTGTPRGTVVVVHGYFDHLALYRHLLDVLLDAGWQVVLWDLPGHGLSSGTQASIDDFADYTGCLRALIDHLEGCELITAPLVGIGQSTGAAILATDALERRDTAPWQALVLLAPLVRPWRWTLSRWVHRLASPFLRSMPRQYRANSTDAAFAAFLRQHDPLQANRLPLAWVGAMRDWMPRLHALRPVTLPVLMLQGEQDATVDWPYNLATLGARFPNARIECHPLARHHLVNEAATIRDALFTTLLAFLDAHAASVDPQPHHEAPA